MTSLFFTPHHKHFSLLSAILITSYHNTYHSLSPYSPLLITILIISYHNTDHFLSQYLSQCLSQLITILITSYHNTYHNVYHSLSQCWSCMVKARQCYPSQTASLWIKERPSTSVDWKSVNWESQTAARTQQFEENGKID